MPYPARFFNKFFQDICEEIILLDRGTEISDLQIYIY